MRPSPRREILQRGEDIISDTEDIIEKLRELEEFAKSKKRPYMHFKTFHNELQSFVNHFQRMQR